jgi:hypothetical protein
MQLIRAHQPELVCMVRGNPRWVLGIWHFGLIESGNHMVV